MLCVTKSDLEGGPMTESLAASLSKDNRSVINIVSVSAATCTNVELLLETVI